MKPMARRPRFWTLAKISKAASIALMLLTLALCGYAAIEGISDLGTIAACALVCLGMCAFLAKIK